ncbi:chromate transporter, partial [Xanthobacter versatilis]|uniref:chromate transporter n=1 Tax=Xanthobacter autotrophicus (strain ATCC BAA-1158 / Py2) TaxID=78245 RepID=UPI003734FB5E
GMHGTAGGGGLVAGLLFVLPDAVVMLALSILYALYRHIPLIDAAFLSVKAAVLAVVVEALLRISRRAFKNRLMVAIAGLAFLAIYILHIPFPLIILAAGLAGWAGSRAAPELFQSAGHGNAKADSHGVVDQMFERGELAHAEPSLRRAAGIVAVWLPVWLDSVAVLWAALGSDSVWTQIGSFFSLMAVVTFGGAYAVLAYVAQAAVDGFGWLAPGERCWTASGLPRRRLGPWSWCSSSSASWPPTARQARSTRCWRDASEPYSRFG